jgi:hypothetical protein
MESYFKRQSIKRKLNETQLETTIKRLYELYPNKAFSYKKLLKLYGQHGERKLQRVLTSLLNQQFLFRFRYGINSIYVKNPFKR